MPLAQLYRELYTHRRLAFSRRFLPFTIALTAGVIVVLLCHSWCLSCEILPTALVLIWAASTFGLFWSASWTLWFETARLKQIRWHIVRLDFEAAQDSLKKKHRLAGPAYGIRHDLLKASLHDLIGLKVEAHDIVKRLLTRPLMEEERNSVKLAEAFLFHEAGNYRDAAAIFVVLEDSIFQDSSERVRYALLGSRLSEIQNDFKTAKARLEQALDDAAIEDTDKAFLYHNLARLEDTQGNQNTALGYYDQAWSLLKTSGHFLQISITAGNMILLHARAGDTARARMLLSEYEGLVNPDNPRQLLELNNCRIELARQIGDREMLLRAYQASGNEIAPKLTMDELSSLLVSELRMRFSDGVDFQSHLAKTMRHLANAQNSALSHQLRAFREGIGVLRQAVAIIGPRPDLLSYCGWISLQYLAQEASLNSQRATIPATLPVYRQEWLMFKLELIKIKLGFYPSAIPQQDMESLFSTLNELLKIWSDKYNPVGEMNALMTLIDEYAALSEQLGDERFRLDFAGIARTALEQAEACLQENWQQPPMHEFTAGISWFWLRIAGDRDRAKIWLERFESKNLNLNHFQPWYRERYAQTRAWLAQP